MAFGLARSALQGWAMADLRRGIGGTPNGASTSSDGAWLTSGGAPVAGWFSRAACLTSKRPTVYRFCWRVSARSAVIRRARTTARRYGRHLTWVLYSASEKLKI